MDFNAAVHHLRICRKCDFLNSSIAAPALPGCRDWRLWGGVPGLRDRGFFSGGKVEEQQPLFAPALAFYTTGQKEHKNPYTRKLACRSGECWQPDHNNLYLFNY